MPEFIYSVVPTSYNLGMWYTDLEEHPILSVLQMEKVKHTWPVKDLLEQQNVLFTNVLLGYEKTKIWRSLSQETVTLTV